MKTSNRVISHASICCPQMSLMLPSECSHLRVVRPGYVEVQAQYIMPCSIPCSNDGAGTQGHSGGNCTMPELGEFGIGGAKSSGRGSGGG